MTTIVVRGTPAPQGSKRVFKNGGMAEMSKALGPWRDAVRTETQRAVTEPMTGPVQVTIVFYLKRPAGHYRTGRNAHLLRDGAPAYPAGKPDIDKLARAVLDGLTAGGAWKDDGQAVKLYLNKDYGTPGCCIEIKECT